MLGLPLDEATMLLTSDHLLLDRSLDSHSEVESETSWQRSVKIYKSSIYVYSTYNKEQKEIAVISSAERQLRVVRRVLSQGGTRESRKTIHTE